jgi:uncharacterized protein YkwD
MSLMPTSLSRRRTPAARKTSATSAQIAPDGLMQWARPADETSVTRLSTSNFAAILAAVLAAGALLAAPALAAPRHHAAHASDSCAGANLAPTSENLESVSAATLCLVNRERERAGEPALRVNARLRSAAEGHSRDMVAHDYFDHVSPSGSTLLGRVRAAGFIPRGRGYTLGENIAWGTEYLATPDAIVRAWMSSPGHRANILDRSFRYTGIGVDPAVPGSLADGQPGGMYTQDFGSITS